MTKPVIVPPVGESVSSGVLAAWLKQEGQAVKAGEELFELETDKATLPVTADTDGVLHITTPSGTEVAIGDQVGSIEVGATASAQAATPSPAVSPKPEPTSPPPVAPKPAATQGAAAPASVAKPAPAPVVSQQPAAPLSNTMAQGRSQRRVPMTNLRRSIAHRMVESKLHAAHLTTFNEVDLFEVGKTRARYKEAFEKKHGTRLGYMSFFVRAAARALKEFEAINAYVDGETIVYNDFVDISVAVSTEKGLVTPVLRDADNLSFAQIESTIADFGKRAKERRLMPDELAGGTFTISNGGVFGSLLSTPIPNPPQTAVLGMHSIQERPVVRDGQIVIRPMMYLALTYDHRILDGRDAITFLVRIKTLLEDPLNLMLDL